MQRNGLQMQRNGAAERELTGRYEGNRSIANAAERSITNAAERSSGTGTDRIL